VYLIKFMSDDLLDQAIFKALDDKSLLPKKPIRIGHLVVDKSGVPTPRVQGKRKLTNRKKINASVKRREKNEEV